MNKKIETLEVTIARLNPQPGDTLVITYPHYLTAQQRENISKQLSALTKFNVLVLDGGGTVSSVISATDAPA